MSQVQERVDALDQYEFDSWAASMKSTLELFGYGFANLSPGDATNYKISIVAPPEPRDIEHWQYLAEYLGPPPNAPRGSVMYVATSFGPMYPWNGQQVDTSYVASKWTYGGQVSAEWTAAVICRFLNTLGDLL